MIFEANKKHTWNLGSISQTENFYLAMFYLSLMIINGIYLIISSGRVVARRRKNNN